MSMSNCQLCNKVLHNIHNKKKTHPYVSVFIYVWFILSADICLVCFAFGLCFFQQVFSNFYMSCGLFSYYSSPLAFVLVCGLY